MKLKLLNQKHECWNGGLSVRYNALYEGGLTFRANIDKFLTKNLLEDGLTYERRKQEASYESYINTLVNQFASQLFSSPFIVRSDPDSADSFYAEFKEDCDLNGTDLLTFAHKLFITALVKGSAWVVAEMPDDGNPPPDNLLDYQERGLGRAWLSQVATEEVFDWECDEFGQIKWIITHQLQKRRDNPRAERKTIIETWKLYDQENVETFQAVYQPEDKPTDDTDIGSLGVRKHGFTRVPLLCLKLPVGLWLVNRLADAQVEHFRMNNALGWAMRRSCYPTAVFNTDDDDSGKLSRSADGFGVKIGKEEKLGWISPPTESFEMIANRVATFKDEIHRLALQMALSVDNSAGMAKRSGESKAQDMQATEIILYSYADLVKAFVEEIFELVSDARGDVETTFSIEGMDQFVIDDSTAVLEAATAAKQFNIPSETFNKELACKLTSVLLPNLAQDVKDKIREEILSAKVEAPEPVEAPEAPPGQKAPAEPEDADRAAGES